MKSLFVYLALAAATVSHADVLTSTNVASITQFNLDPNFAKKEQVTGGTVTYNLETKTATLTLNRKWYCPPGAMCSMEMPAPTVIVLPIVEAKTNSCGDQMIVAKRDLRPVDGNMQSLRIVHISNATCRRIVEAKNTAEFGTSMFSRMDGKEYRTYSKFELSRFAGIY